MIRRLITLCALLPATALLGACTTDSDESVTPVAETSFKVRFQPSAALIPFPNDIWRNGSTDGTLNIYQGNTAFDDDPLISQVDQMNLLDGFGLNSAIHADFTEPLNEATLAFGQTVFVFSVATGGVPHTPALISTFEVGTADFQGGRSVLELNPTAPLSPLTTYAVILTDNIQSSAGEAVSADIPFQAMLDAWPAETANSGDATTDAVYAQMVKPLLDLAEGAGIGAANVAAAWTFTTQSVGNSLSTMQASGFFSAQTNAIVPMGMTTADINPQLSGLADVYAGGIEMPYYQDRANPLTSYWQSLDAACQTAIGAGLISEASESTTAYCPLPEEQSIVTIPMLITVPNADAFAANPACGGTVQGVVIFQHGITQNRTNAFAVADTLARACHAVVAIDMPLHGITDATSGLFAAETNPLYAALDNFVPGMAAAITEPTFNLDLVNNETGEEGADEAIDPSGSYFINLESPITSRDSLRQAAVNLLNLKATIPVMDYNAAVDGGASGADFAGLPVRFVGMSLGSMVGVPFLATNATTDAAVLAVPGGDITDLLLDSPTFAPRINQGLADNGLTEGMRFYDEFFRNAQTVIESGEPINYAAAANANTNILMFEVVGGAGNDPDQVIPNSATEKLADAMGLPTVTSNVVDNTNGVDGRVQFNAGSHSSLLSPTDSAAVTTEMQTEMAIFIGGNPLIPADPGGHAIIITDGSVIAQ